MEKTELNSHMGFKSVSNIGLEKKNTLDLELVVWASSSHICLLEGTSCSSYLMTSLEDGLPRPLPIRQGSLKATYSARKSTCPTLPDQAFSSPVIVCVAVPEDFNPLSP